MMGGSVRCAAHEHAHKSKDEEIGPQGKESETSHDDEDENGRLPQFVARGPAAFPQFFAGRLDVSRQAKQITLLPEKCKQAANDHGGNR